MAVIAVLPGMKTMWRDYYDSWTDLSGRAAQRARRRVAVRYFVVPTVVASPFLVWHIEMPTVAPFLTAMSVFTALLFGLLFLVFNLAVTLRKDSESIASAHDLPALVEDMRATITYTIVVAITLVAALTLASVLLTTTTPGPLTGYGWAWTPILVWGGTHLGLNLMKVLERFRTAFNYISR